MAAQTRRALGNASHRFHVGSRTFALGALLTGSVGVLASIPLVARIHFPRVTARIRQVFGQMVQTPPVTRLRLERTDPAAGPENGHRGFNLDEMTDIGERLLRDIGLTSGFARLVILLGHSSKSLNNPHNSAYCCGRGAGGPNARAVAKFLNDPRVREGLAPRGLLVPKETVFLGGEHRTSDDTVTFYDLGLIPDTHWQAFQEIRATLAATCEHNAHERCRRFMSAPLTMSFAAAREQVEERSEDLAQTRPEYGRWFQGHHTQLLTGFRELGTLWSWPDWHELSPLVFPIISPSGDTADSTRFFVTKITRATWN